MNRRFAALFALVVLMTGLLLGGAVNEVLDNRRDLDDVKADVTALSTALEVANGRLESLGGTPVEAPEEIIDDPDPDDPDPDDPERQEAEVQDAETQDPEVDDPEIQDPEVQDFEPDDPDIDDPDPDDPDPDDPEIQDPEVQDPEVDDPETQDPEVDDPDPPDDCPEGYTAQKRRAFGEVWLVCVEDPVAP